MPILLLNLILLCACDLRPNGWRELATQNVERRNRR